MSVTHSRARRARQGCLRVRALFAVLVLAGCRTDRPAPLRGDALLLAPTSEFLDAQLALVEAGELEAARRQWAERSLIPDPPPADYTLLHDRSRMLRAAVERWTHGPQDGQAIYRLARSLTDARWHREALLAAERAVDRDPTLSGARELATMLAHLDLFRARLDSAASAVYARARLGDIEPRELTRFASALADSFGYTAASLASRGLYIGQRPIESHGGLWEIELSVIVGVEPAVTVRKPDGEVDLRRVLIDHNRLPRFAAGDRSGWRLEPGIVGHERELTVYHDVDAHRRAGARLFRALEARGGAPPSTVEAAPTAIDGDAERTTAANGDSRCDPRLAVALRLRAVAPLFAQVRTAGGSRDAMVRAFVRAFMRESIDQIEARLVRSYLDQLGYAEVYGPQRLAERRLLAGLQSGPLPLWELAGIIDAACVPGSTDAHAIAARSVLRFLEKTLEIDRPAGFLEVTEPELRDAALTIAIDRFGSG